MERAGKIRILEGAVADILGGESRLVVITGSCGTGKSALLQEFSGRIPDSAHFLSATASPAENSQQFGVLFQLLRYARPLAAAESPWGSILDLLAERGPDDERVHRIGAAFAEVARQAPVVVGVDDIQHVDFASLQVLCFLLRRLPSLRLLLVVTDNDNGRATSCPFRSELVRNSRAWRLRLGPLGRDGVAELLTEQLGAERAAALTPEFHALTGGNPLLVRVGAEEYLIQGATALDAERRAGCGVHDELSRAFMALLHSAGEGTVAVATAIAVLGADAAPARIARLVGERAAVVEWIVDSLAAAGLTEGCRFRNAGFETAVVDRLPPEERVALHCGAAWLLYEDGRAAGDIARHLLRAGAADEPWAYKVLREAAVDALAADDPEFALECLRMAAETCPDLHERADISVVRFAVEWMSDPGFAHRWFDSLLDTAREGHLHGPRALELVAYLIWHGRLDDAAECLRRVRAAAGDDGQQPGPETVVVMEWIEFLWPSRATGPRSAPPAGELNRPILTGRGPRVFETLRGVLRGGSDPQTGAALREIANGWSLPSESMEAMVGALLAAIYAGCTDFAESWCEALMREAAERQTTTWEAVLCAVRGLIAARRGQPPTAARYALRALELMPARGWGIGICAPLAVLISACTVMGRAEEAAAWLNHPVPDAAFQTHFGPLYLHARGEYRLAAGRPDAALADFGTCGELLRGWGMDTPGYLPWRTSAAAARLALGEAEQARNLADQQRRHSGGHDPMVRAAALRISAAARPLRERPTLLQEALTVLSGAEESLEMILVLVELSRAFRELGLSGRARSTARRAWNLAQIVGVEAMCTRLLTPDLVAHLDVADDSESQADDSVTLTDSELAVARLAALEHTNREISRKLSITVSTVEQHLTRVYRKLGVAGRKEIRLVLRVLAADSA
ncbi:AAA family ATPase [Nocardia sp. NPDC057353]|uniref:helix-turn-helix transcriptional regulator n=1 Tax=Nocardia sp. NPDC057353 TaxID=3346104 RepID=UPI00363B5D82